MATDSTRHYRVEHHEGAAVRLLGSITNAAPHHTTLEPFVSELLRTGADGQVLLVEEATERIVARRQIRPFGCKPRARFRKLER